MCLTQLIQYPIFNLLAGFGLGIVASWIATHFYWCKAERMGIIQDANNLIQNCHHCIDLLRSLRSELAQRKYTSYHLLQKVTDLDRELQQRTINSEALKVEQAEISFAALENLLIDMTSKKIDAKTKKRHCRRIGRLMEKMDCVIEKSEELMIEIENIDKFSQYFSNIDSSLELKSKKYIEFIEKLEAEEELLYEGLIRKTKLLREEWINLILSKKGITLR